MPANADPAETAVHVVATDAQTVEYITSYALVSATTTGVLIADGTVYIPVAGVEAVALPPAPAPTGP